MAHLSEDKKAFDELLRTAGTNIDEYAKRGGDYVVDLLDLPSEQKTVEALVDEIHKDIGANYQYIGKQSQHIK